MTEPSMAEVRELLSIVKMVLKTDDSREKMKDWKVKQKVVYSVETTVAYSEKSMVRMEDVTVALSAGRSADC